jgi:Arc/MetJ-type ribon-helix-helix transcriptional regulator
MAYRFPPELAELVEKHLATGEYSSEDEVLLHAMRSLEAQRDDWAAIEKSLTTLEQGDQGVSLNEAFDTIRKGHNIPQDA